MSLRSIHYRRRAQQQARRNPVWVTFRRVTRLDGPNPTSNPPAISGALAVAGAQGPGLATITLRAPKLRGRVIAGDRFTIAGTTYTATGAATDGGANTIAVPIASATFTVSLADGAAVTAAWAADTRIPARLLDYGQRLIDGEMIQRGDQKITFAAADLAFDPDEQDQIILANGTVLTVIGAVASRMDGDPITWDLQVR